MVHQKPSLAQGHSPRLKAAPLNIHRETALRVVAHLADTSVESQLTLGLIWALTPYGFRGEVVHTRLAREIGSRYIFHGQHIPQVDVRVGLGGTSIQVRKAARTA